MAPDAPQPIRLVPVAKPAGTAESKSKLTFVMPPEPPVPPAPLEQDGEPNGKNLPHRKKIVVHAHPSQPSAVQPFPKPPQKKSGKAWLWILLVVLLASAGGAGWWFMTKSNGEVNNGVNATMSTATMPASPVPSSSETRKANQEKTVNPILNEHHLALHVIQFGGRVVPEQFSFSSTNIGCKTGWPRDKLSGNPVYFMSDNQLLWDYYATAPGDGRIFSRAIDGYNEQMLFGCRLMLESAVASDMRGTSFENQAKVLCNNAMLCSRRYPAPVVLAYTNFATHFLYLNDFGNPSALRWGEPMKYWFWCYEGEEALAQYASCLRELKEKLAEYTVIAKEEGLRTYRKTIDLKNFPSIYVGQLDEGTREKATVEYEFFIDDSVCKIKEIAKCKSGTYSKSWTSESLDSELEFFSRVDSASSIEKAFEPLYCFLSQKKILLEEASLEAKRINERMEGKESTNNTNGKKKQKLTFSPIGKQNVDANVELEATAESGGKIVFSVESGPGKITGNTLTFTGTGTVELQARQWGNEHWFSATATQSVEVVQAPATQHVELKNTGGISPSEPRQNVRDSGPIPKVTGQEQKGGQLLHEFAPLAKALEAAKRSPTGANYKALMTAWEELPKKQKDAASKPVLWAFSAMLCAKGQADEVLKHQSLIDYPAFRDTVSNPCKTCGGGGRSRVKCETCGGTGTHRVKCNACKGTGICSFCRGTGLPTGSMSGRALQCSNCRGTGKCKSCSRGIAEKPCADCRDGMRSLRCPTCNGSGRIYPADKCERVAQENIEEALRLCKGIE